MTKKFGFLKFGSAKIHDPRFFKDFSSLKKKDEVTTESGLSEELLKAQIETIDISSSTLLPYPRPPVIGIGTVGTRIVESMSTLLGNEFPDPPLLFSITIGDSQQHEKNEHVNYLILPSEQYGTNRQYLQGIRHFERNSSLFMDELYSKLKRQQQKGRLIFLVFGAGGTGVGGALYLARELKKQGFIPVAIHILPLTSENSITLFNSAVALYKLSLARIQDSIGVITIPIDQEPFYKNNKGIPHQSLILQINYRIATVIIELIKSILVPSDGYIIDYSDFESVFSNYKGLGIFFYGSAKISDSPSIPSFVETVLEKGRCLNHDPLTGTRGYVFLQTPKDLLVAKDYEDVLKIFSKIDVFPRIKETSKDTVIIMGVMTGVSLPEKIRNLLSLADELRVNLLNQELSRITTGETVHNIDKLAHVEGQDNNLSVQSLKEYEEQEKNSQR